MPKLVQRKADIPMQLRRAAIGKVDAETRTAELVWSTGAQVRKYDFWEGKRFLEELSLDPKHVDLKRLNSGAPLLNSHQAYDLDGVVGVVEKAWIDDGKEGRAKVRFSKREDADAVFRDVQDGIIRNASVGYNVRKYEITEKEGQLPVYRAVDWEPMEISLVPVGADAGAGVRAQDTRSFECEFVVNQPAVAGVQRKEQQMPEESNTELATPTPEVAQAEAVRKAAQLAATEAAKAERERIAEIRSIGSVGKMEDGWAQPFIDNGTSVDEVRKAYFAEQVKRYEATATRSAAASITLGQEPRDKRVIAMTEALLHRVRPVEFKLTEGARLWSGMRLLEMGRLCLEEQGIETRGQDPMRLAGMIMGNVPLARAGMHTTSDFPNVLQAVAQKTLRAAYERAPRTFLTIFKEGSLSDFRPTYRNQLGDMDAFEKVNEHGEFKYGTFGESKEQIQLATYGKIFAFTRQMLINDDLNMLDRLPSYFGFKAADLESDVAWGVVTSNPVMSDGNAYFSSAHGNLAGAGAAPSVATLGAARGALRVQRASAGGGYLNLQAKYLVIPTTLETAADQLLAQTTPEQTSSVVPQFIRSLNVVVEPRLDANSTTAWYLFADPAAIDTIEYAYLNGQRGVQTETREGFNIDGTEMRGRIDFGAAAIDWRGAYKNPGA